MKHIYIYLCIYDQGLQICIYASTCTLLCDAAAQARASSSVAFLYRSAEPIDVAAILSRAYDNVCVCTSFKTTASTNKL